jgi:hypothetical protein
VLTNKLQKRNVQNLPTPFALLTAFSCDSVYLLFIPLLTLFVLNSVGSLQHSLAELQSVQRSPSARKKSLKV